MIEAHGGLGELLAVVYLAIAIGAIVRGDRGLPAWLTGTAHALLAVQILMGIYLIIQYPESVPWTHPLVGLLTLVGLALLPALRRRLGAGRGTAVSALAVAVLTSVAVMIAMTG